MIELCAVTYSDVGAAIRHERDAAGRPMAFGTLPNYYKECGRSVSMGISLAAAGDEPVEQFVYDSPEISLICRTDVLFTDSQVQEDFNTDPARSLAERYKRFGDSLANGLRGTFAIILYEKKQRVLKAWTDHFGAERLVFTNPRGFLAVATDARLLLPLLSQRPDIDPAAVQQYLQYTCIPAPKTIFKGISRLAPGHQLISRPALSTRAYWDMSFVEANAHRSETAWAADTLDALRSSVSLNRGGVDSAQLGCFLSG
jgi:hypothetical protein